MTDKQYEIEFWQDADGYSESQDYIWELKQKAIKSKDARIKLKKDYIIYGNVGDIRNYNWVSIH